MRAAATIAVATCLPWSGCLLSERYGRIFIEFMEQSVRYGGHFCEISGIGLTQNLPLLRRVSEYNETTKMPFDFSDMEVVCTL